VTFVKERHDAERAFSPFLGPSGIVNPARRPWRAVRRGRKTLGAPQIESERFAKDSWFVGGIDAYIEILLKTPLP
jgi:hypothetical protein